jgi:hypothetical protein
MRPAWPANLWGCGTVRETIEDPISHQRYTVDRAATRAAYARQPAGGATTCTCNGCRNFLAARDRIFPSRFVEFLESLGIDPTKEAEAYRTGQLAPGRHHYGGWYHLNGWAWYVGI